MILADVRFDERSPVKMYTDIEESIRTIADEGSNVLDSIITQRKGKQRRRSHSESEVQDKNSPGAKASRGGRKG